MTELPQRHIRIWLGGSFDPVHKGHLAIIEHIAKVLQDYLDSHKSEQLTVTISLLPTARNPFKTHPTDNIHRLAMLALGLEYLKESTLQQISTSIHFQIDTAEIYQSETVFTFNTFSQFRKIFPDDSLIFVLGKDSILMFDKWYRGFELRNLCHLWVMPRGQDTLKEGLETAENLPDPIQPYVTQRLADLITAPNGHIYLDNYQVLPVSSSQIRAALAVLHKSDKNLINQWLIPSVMEYILENRLYQVSQL